MSAFILGALTLLSPPGVAQSPIVGVDPALIEDIVVGRRVLAEFGVLDGFGYVSARHPTNAGRFLMARSLAPALVTADDIMEFDLDGNPLDAKGRAIFIERLSTPRSTGRART